MTQTQDFRACPAQKFVVEKELKKAAMDRTLRPVVTCSAPAWFVMDGLAETVVVTNPAGQDGEPDDFVGKAHLRRLSYGMRLNIYAHAQRLNIRDLLEDLEWDAAFEIAYKLRSNSKH